MLYVWNPASYGPAQSPPVARSSAPSADVPEQVGCPGLPTRVSVVVTAVRGTSVRASPSTRTVTVGPACAGAASSPLTTSAATTIFFI